jgi:hypothetical protein
LEFKKRITELYGELFGETNGLENTTALAGFSQKWGWYQSIYGLCNGNIRKIDEVTKMKLHTCLIHLAFEKEKAELEKHIINRNAKR